MMYTSLLETKTLIQLNLFTFFRHCNDYRKTPRFLEQIMFADKDPSVFPQQMEAIV